MNFLHYWKAFKLQLWSVKPLKFTTFSLKKTKTSHSSEISRTFFYNPEFGLLIVLYVKPSHLFFWSQTRRRHITASNRLDLLHIMEIGFLQKLFIRNGWKNKSNCLNSLHFDWFFSNNFISIHDAAAVCVLLTSSKPAMISFSSRRQSTPSCLISFCSKYSSKPATEANITPTSS